MSLHIILILLWHFLAIFLLTGHVDQKKKKKQDRKQKIYLKNKSENIITLRLISLCNNKIAR